MRNSRTNGSMCFPRCWLRLALPIGATGLRGGFCGGEAGGHRWGRPGGCRLARRVCVRGRRRGYGDGDRAGLGGWLYKAAGRPAGADEQRAARTRFGRWWWWWWRLASVGAVLGSPRARSLSVCHCASRSSSSCPWERCWRICG
jgi:hypothetical protein